MSVRIAAAAAVAASSPVSPPVSALFSSVPMIVSTAFHWSVRGRQFGGAWSASASTGKYGLAAVRLASLRTLVLDGMPLFWAYVIWVSFWSIHLMKSAAACWFFDAFGTPSNQLPIMPTPLPLLPAGIGMNVTLPATFVTAGSRTAVLISPGQTDDW